MLKWLTQKEVFPELWTYVSVRSINNFIVETLLNYTFVKKVLALTRRNNHFIDPLYSNLT